MKKILKQELAPLFMLAAMCIIFITVTIVGVIHLVIKSLIESFQWKFWRGIVKFVKYWLNVIYQLWNTFKFLCLQIAIALDIFENVLGGEALEDIITAEEETLFGKGTITISTATGELEFKNKLNSKGVAWTKLLSKVLDDNHSVVSYKRYLHNQTFKLD